MSFQEVKNGLLNDLQYLGDSKDQFWRDQYSELVSRFEKSRGWDELLWRLQSIQPALAGFKQLSPERWAEAIAKREVPKGIATQRFKKVDGYDVLSDYCRVKNNNGRIVIGNHAFGYMRTVELDGKSAKAFVEWLRLYMPELLGQG
jgi:hypothetical protein